MTSFEISARDGRAVDRGGGRFFYPTLPCRNISVLILRGEFLLNWIGLDWIELDWIGLDWIGLDWIGLD